MAGSVGRVISIGFAFSNGRVSLARDFRGVQPIEEGTADQAEGEEGAEAEDREGLGHDNEHGGR